MGELEAVVKRELAQGEHSRDPVPVEEPCVLVVDDDGDIRQALAEALTVKGYRVGRAANGREALVLMTALNPSVVVLDLMMPEMSGWQLMERMRDDSTLRTIAVVVMTASRETPADVTVVRKPFRMDDLVASMRTAMARAPAGFERDS